MFNNWVGPHGISNKAEAAFARVLLQTGREYIYQPQPFMMRPPYRSYQPDFYVPSEKRFYEVIGNRGRWLAARHKIERFRDEYPTVDLRVVDAAGELYHAVVKNRGGASAPGLDYMVRCIPSELYTLARRKADAEGRSLRWVLVKMLEAWAQGTWTPSVDKGGEHEQG